MNFSIFLVLDRFYVSLSWTCFLDEFLKLSVKVALFFISAKIVTKGEIFSVFSIMLRIVIGRLIQSYLYILTFLEEWFKYRVQYMVIQCTLYGGKYINELSISLLHLLLIEGSMPSFLMYKCSCLKDFHLNLNQWMHLKLYSILHHEQTETIHYLRACLLSAIVCRLASLSIYSFKRPGFCFLHRIKQHYLVNLLRSWTTH